MEEGRDRSLVQRINQQPGGGGASGGGSSPGARQAGLEPDSGLRRRASRMDSEAISEIG